MWGWIALGIVVAALIVLAVVARGTVATVRPLRRAIQDLEARRSEVERTQAAVAGMETSLADVMGRVEITKDRLATVKENAARIRERPR